MNTTILFVGLDTAKTYTEVAYSLDNREHKPCSLGRIRTTKQAVQRGISARGISACPYLLISHLVPVLISISSPSHLLLKCQMFCEDTSCPFTIEVTK